MLWLDNRDIFARHWRRAVKPSSHKIPWYQFCKGCTYEFLLNDQHDQLGSGQQVCTHAFEIAGSFFESRSGEAANRKASPLAVGPKLCIYEVFFPFNRIFGPTLDCGRLGINMFVLPVNHEYHGYVDLPILLYRGALSGMEMAKRFPTISDPLQAKMRFLVLVLKVRFWYSK